MGFFNTEAIANTLGDANSGILGSAKDAAVQTAVKSLEDANVLPAGILSKPVPAQVQAAVTPAAPRYSDGPRSDGPNQPQADLNSKGAFATFYANHKLMVWVGAAVLALAVTGVGAKLLRKAG